MKRSVAVTTITPTATASGSTNLVDATYPCVVQCASSTQRNAISEIYLGGQATVSSPTIMLLGRDGQLGPGTMSFGTGQTDTALDASATAVADVVKTGNSWLTNKPQRSATFHLLNLSFNAFGGIVRWVAYPGEEIFVVGTSAVTGEVSLSAFTGGTPGALGAHLIYETA